MRRALGLLALAVALTACTPTGTAPAPAEPTAAQATVPAVSRPTRIRIPSLNVDANIIDLGLQSDGTMQVPPDAKDAGWYTRSPSPGETGPSVVVAHVNWKGTDGPFAHIDQLKAGDTVDVEHDNGTVATFTVDRVETFPKDDYPSDQVYADTADPELRMITCGGSFDTAAHSYRDNVVVFAKLAT
jgi:LPXTG-site transpeptidase (sortase) family protein